jgi:hypothetical protein
MNIFHSVGKSSDPVTFLFVRASRVPLKNLPQTLSFSRKSFWPWTSSKAAMCGCLPRRAYTSIRVEFSVGIPYVILHGLSGSDGNESC